MRRGVGNRVVRWLAVAAMCVLPVQGFGYNTTVSPNAVISNSIKPADGTTGQDVLSGSGVKTGHIQDGAVTTPKIADGAVTDAKITGPISGSKLGAHAHDGADVVDGTITGSKIADGAISNAKIESLSASKIIGNIGVDKIGAYAGVKIVHKGAVDGINSFNSIGAAIGSITNNSATNRYVVVVMPGVYEEVVSVGSSYIDIVGQSKAGSIIRGGIISTSNMLISNLTIEDTTEINSPILIASGSNNVTINDCMINTNYYGGIKIDPNSNVSIDSVKINISGLSAGIWMNGVSSTNKIFMKNILISGPGTGVVVNGGDASLDHLVTMIDSTIEAASYGVFLNWGKISMANVTINTTNGYDVGLYINQIGKAYCDRCNISSLRNYAFNVDGNSNSALEITNSNISGAVGSNIPIKIGNSKLDVPFGGSLTSGTAKLVNCYDGNFDPIPNGAY